MERHVTAKRGQGSHDFAWLVHYVRSNMIPSSVTMGLAIAVLQFGYGGHCGAFLLHSQDIINDKKPNFIFLIETLCASNKIAEIQSLLDYDGFVNVDCVGHSGGLAFGHSGGLALLWKGVSSINLISSSSRYIDVEVELPREEVGLNLIILFGDSKFQAAISDAHLYDFPMSGYAFTWEHGRTSGNLIEEKLDHILATDSWRRKFSQARAMVLDKSSSDHLPIYLELRHFMPRAQRTAVGLAERISRCRALLEVWGEEFRHYQKGEFATCLAIMAATIGSRIAGDNVRFLEAKNRYQELLLQKEIFWKQRAKEFWLREGDANTCFFHRRASACQQQNRISSLRDESGNWCHLNSGLEDLMPVITEEQNEFLLAPYSIEDVRAAVFDMKADKAPGLDGFNPGFFQGYWDIIGNDIALYCIEIIHSRSIPDYLNVTGLVLIPKKSSPESMTDLRPIALCNVLLKVITKMLANRLQIVFALFFRVCSESQECLFVAGRKYSDNCTFEALHAFHRTTRGSNFSAAVKMDISKAYDRMEWSFHRQMLTKLGFHALWINLIMSTLTSVKYWILRNNRELGPIIPTRGLRQGDPLSPYLFIICAEGLSNIIQMSIQNDNLSGFRVCRRGPLISHLFFADDSLVFLKASVQESQSLKHILAMYSQTYFGYV
ncbi:uncharacterized protein LOC119369500 [Jatropha curcas]|uniref:uncharacterized protein LOC119369500 n=1 Tax=Jatropha curcas TaxID=180498 RepID=UPI0018951129|nr:uncharacterized protein LOC119369500 [Jatropha curcas]